MVYTKVIILYGKTYTRKELFRYLLGLPPLVGTKGERREIREVIEGCMNEGGNFDIYTYYELEDAVNEAFSCIRGEPKLYRQKHGVEDEDDFFIIGREIASYNRVHMCCNKCGPHSLCDFCLGYTNNGSYTITHEFQHIPDDEICDYCLGHDPKKSEKKIGEPCKHCGLSRENKGPKRRVEKMLETLKDRRFPHPKGCGYYLTINDCVCCT